MVTITGSEKRVYMALKNAQGTKTTAELATEVSLKPNSFNTVVNQLRKKFKDAGVEWKYNVKSTRQGSESLEAFLETVEQSA